jgi:hypothetical protein
MQSLFCHAGLTKPAGAAAAALSELAGTRLGTGSLCGTKYMKTRFTRDPSYLMARWGSMATEPDEYDWPESRRDLVPPVRVSRIERDCSYRVSVHRCVCRRGDAGMISI